MVAFWVLRNAPSWPPAFLPSGDSQGPKEAAAAVHMDPVPTVEATEAGSAPAADKHEEQSGARPLGHQRYDASVADAGHHPTALHPRRRRGRLHHGPHCKQEKMPARTMSHDQDNDDDDDDDDDYDDGDSEKDNGDDVNKL